MQTHPIENIMKTTMENIKDMIDVNTVVGNAVATSSGATIIPLSRVAFGFVSGGGEYGEANEKPQGMMSANGGEAAKDANNPFAGGSGAGVSVSPVAFLIVSGEQIKLLAVDHDTTLDRVVELVPQLITDIQNIASKANQTPAGTSAQNMNNQNSSVVIPS